MRSHFGKLKTCLKLNKDQRTRRVPMHTLDRVRIRLFSEDYLAIDEDRNMDIKSIRRDAEWIVQVLYYCFALFTACVTSCII